MSNPNSMHNRAVWFDIPVTDLDRAAAFYRAVLGVDVARAESNGVAFCVLEHSGGNGGCLIPNHEAISSTGGILVYLNVDGRIRDAVAKVGGSGGRVVTPVHGIGPHGFVAEVLDSEGNRIALHSTTDA